jgi:hypothetical protein
MGSITAQTAKEIIAADGHYYDDPKAAKVVVYTTPEGQEQHAIVYPHEYRMRYEESPWCLNVRVLWEDSNG